MMEKTKFKEHPHGRMRVLVCVTAALILMLILPLSGGAAFFNHGTVTVTPEQTSVTIAEGGMVSVPVQITPLSDRQLIGCEMDECPEICGGVGGGCIDSNGHCVCAGLDYYTYDTDVSVVISDQSVAGAVFSNGILHISGLGPGEADVMITASLRHWTGATETIAVTVGAPQSQPDPKAELQADGNSYADEPVGFKLRLGGYNDINVVEVGFTAENLAAAGAALELYRGFELIGDFTLTHNPATGMLSGRFTMGLMGVDKLDSSAVMADIAKLSFTAQDLGEAKLTLTEVKVTGYAITGHGITYNADFTEKGAASTIVVEKQAPFPIHDINKDGKVDSQDLSIGLAAFGAKSSDPGWDGQIEVDIGGVSVGLIDFDKGAVITYAMCDVNTENESGGEIDILDLIDIIANYDD